MGRGGLHQLQLQLQITISMSRAGRRSTRVSATVSRMMDRGKYHRGMVYLAGTHLRLCECDYV